MAGVESLELQIKGNAKSAEKSINALIETLNRLKKATTGACGLDKVTGEMTKMSTQMSKIKNLNLGLSSANTKSAKSFSILGSKALVGAFSIHKITNAISSWITKSNDYVENLNLFTVSMGEYAESAQKYAETVGEAMGIDPSTWMRNQGVFMTLATGFGVASDRAATMSQQLTQLGYDLSSFFNISVEDAMQKLQSGLSGELEPLRRLGYDLSQAKLQAVALSLGIDKTFNSMTQAEKSQLRYYAIMTQVTKAHGDMARTLDAPANQLRVFKAQAEQAARSLGNIFIPALNKVLPYAIAFMKIIREAANEIANLFGFSLPEVDYSGVTDGVSSVTEELDEATGSAKKLKKMLLGIDELNVMNDPNSGSGGAGGSDGSAFDFELPTYDFMSGITSNVDEAYKKLKKILKPLGKIIDLIKDYKDLVLLGVGVAAIVKLWAKLKLVWAWFTGLKLVDAFITGFSLIHVTGGNLIQSFVGGLDNIRYNLTGLQKAAIVAVAGFVEFKKIRDNVKDIALGCEDVGNKIAGIGVVAAGAAVAMYAALGPAGLAVAAVVGLTGAFVGFAEAQEELRKGLVDSVFYDGIGVSADDLELKLRALTEEFDIQGDQIGEWATQIESNNETITKLNSSIETLSATLGITGVVTQEEVDKIKEQFASLYESVRDNMSLSEEIIMTALVGALQRATPEISAQIDILIGEYQRYVRETQGRAEELKGLIESGYDELIGKHVDDPAYMEIREKIQGWYEELGYLNGSMSESGWKWQQVVADFNNNKIDFGSTVEEASEGLGNLASVGETALNDVVAARDEVLKQIDEEIAYAAKYKTEDLELLYDIRAQLEADYASQENAIKSELNTIFEAVQNSMINKIRDTKSELESNWKNMGWFEKWYYGFSEEKYVHEGLMDLQEHVDEIAEAIRGNMGDLKTDGSVWADEAMRGIMDALFDSKNVNSEWSGAHSVYSYAMDLEDAISQVFADLEQSGTKFSSDAGANIADGVGAGIEAKFGELGDVLSEGVEAVLGDALSGDKATAYGSKFGTHLGSGIAEGLKDTKLPTINGNVTTKSGGSTLITFTAYAGGGFPTAGEMFVAREAGPEMVGSIGNRTAVANNDQIVESVSAGVYQAVVSAMGQSGGTQVVEAKVNDKVLFEVLVDRNRRETMRTGSSPLLGGV